MGFLDCSENILFLIVSEGRIIRLLKLKLRRHHYQFLFYISNSGEGREGYFYHSFAFEQYRQRTIAWYTIAHAL